MTAEQLSDDVGSLLRVDLVRNRHAVCIQLVGELDLSTTDQLAAAAAGAMVRGRLPVLIDVSALTFCDVRGVAELLSLEQRLAASGRTVAVVGASRPLRRLLRVTGADLRVSLW
ncbi:MAG TPA: STAS domain-containing protein [Nocardioidaceae bacterium]|nr:STAS domain-containing protein [Nocardioidaceae bacterium]